MLKLTRERGWVKHNNIIDLRKIYEKNNMTEIRRIE
jgi:hypothetical protein